MDKTKTRRMNNGQKKVAMKSEVKPTPEMTRPVSSEEARSMPHIPPVVEEVENKEGLVESRINLIVPSFRPWKGSGRLVVQPFKVNKPTAPGGKIIVVAGPKSPTIDPRVHCIVVAKDPAIHGIEVEDEVLFAEDFIPTSRTIDGIYYYLPHYLDVLLIMRPDKKVMLRR